MKALKELAKARAAYLKKIEDAGKSAVQEAARTVFDAHPEIGRIEWTQYTPYFNDGDPCVFSINEVYFLRLDEIDEESEYTDEREDIIDATSGWGDNKKILLASAAEFAQLVEDNEDLMETLGEGKVVISRKAGVSIEDVDHD